MLSNQRWEPDIVRSRDGVAQVLEPENEAHHANSRGRDTVRIDQLLRTLQYGSIAWLQQSVLM